MAKTIILKRTTLPDFLPHGWKAEVARALGIHRNSVRNAIEAGRGELYERIKQVAIQKWGKGENY